MKQYRARRLMMAGIVIGAVATAPASAAAADNAVQFAGPNQYLTFPDSNAFDTTASNLQVSADVKLTTPTANGYILHKPRQNSTNFGGVGLVLSNGRPCLAMNRPAGFEPFQPSLCSVHSLPTNFFQRVTATYNGTVITMKVGSYALETSAPIPFGPYETDQNYTSSPLVVGRSSTLASHVNTPTNGFSGRLDNLRVGRIGEAPLVEAKFDEGTGTTTANTGSLGGVGTFAPTASPISPPTWVAGRVADSSVLTCVQTGVVRAPSGGGFDTSTVSVAAPSGLADIVGVTVTNGSLTVPDYLPGTTSPVIVTATKAVQGTKTVFAFDATTIGDRIKRCQ